MRRQRGVTLLEMLVVLALVSLMAGISFPAVTAGLDSLRLRSAGDEVVSFLYTGLTFAERREQVMELRISRATNQLSFRNATGDFHRDLTLPESITITRVDPAPAGEQAVESSVMLYPGGSFPSVRIELTNRRGTHRVVRIDPVSGVPMVEVPDVVPAGETK